MGCYPFLYFILLSWQDGMAVSARHFSVPIKWRSTVSLWIYAAENGGSNNMDVMH
jgi:hypothetical protein